MICWSTWKSIGSIIRQTERATQHTYKQSMANLLRLALDIGVPARRINEIVHGIRRITADTALRLAKYFNMSPQFWLGLQMDHDLDIAEDKLAERLDIEVRKYAKAS